MVIQTEEINIEENNMEYINDRSNTQMPAAM